MQKITHSYKFVLVNDQGRRIGQDHHRAKLTDVDVDQIFMLREYGLSYSQIAGKFDDIEGGISKETVRDVLKGRRRGQVPFATKKVLVRASAVLWLPALANEFPSTV
jgi:hypothetical protein